MDILKPKLEDFIDTRDIPTLPEAARAAITRTLSMEKTVDEIASIIRENPSLTLKILKVANSPLYTAGKRISKMRDAIILLGYKTIKSLILSIYMRDIFADRKHEWFDYGAFWIHSIATAVIAEEIGKTIFLKSEDDLYSSGLLHDIGKAVLLISTERMYREAIKSIEEKRYSFKEAERVLFGFDHTDVASFLFQYWEIPEHITIPVRDHHLSPDYLAEHPHQPTLIVVLANEIAHLGGFYTHLAEPPYQTSRVLIEKLGLNREDIEKILGGLRERLATYAEAMNIPRADVKGYFDVLSKANRELGNMYLATRQMTEEITRKSSLCQTLNKISTAFLRERRIESAAKSVVESLITYLKCSTLILEVYLNDDKSLMVKGISPVLIREEGLLTGEKDIDIKEEIIKRGEVKVPDGAKTLPVQMAHVELGKLTIDSDVPIPASELDPILSELALGLNNIHLHFTNRIKSENLNIALKQLREEYHEKQRLSRLNDLIIQSSPEGILTINKDGSIIQFNRIAEEIIGEPLSGKNLFNTTIFKEKDMKKAISSLEKTEKPVTITLTPGEKLCHLLIKARGIKDTENILIIIKDITEEVEQEKINIQKEKMATLGELAAGIAHNLRSPLAVIKGIPELLLSELENKTLKISRIINGVETEDTEVAENLGLISRSMEKAFSIIDSIMEFSKVDAGKFEEIELEALLNEIYNLMKHRFQGKKISFNNNTKTCKLFADKNMLTQIFVNLFNNSIAAIEESGTIEVSYLKEKGRTIIHFIDDGRGIEPQNLELIFEPFFTTTGKANGAGIGLCITRKMVTLHGGSIKALPRKGGGTIIEIIFPSKAGGK